MKTLRFIFVALMTLFSVNSFSQTTHTFTLDNTDFTTTGTLEVQVGDVINFVNGYANTEFYAKLNGSTQSTQTYLVGQTIYSYTVPNMVPFTIKVGVVNNSLVSEEISFTVTQSTASIDENILTYNVYPNPTTDFINIDGVDVQSVKVFDMSGKLMISENSTKLDVSYLPNGYYTLLINDEKVFKIVKK